ncbi:hypothetical protein GQ607_017493 [Colletotrichum asianum]|uniref:Uncharacterized protein n=1 Tax=Colletotrichum asianum TaxID=702518 RepID=A0A8H3VYZ6_9PEZI|nr:hypothetical protein GQ607_017493 [Colletotrichum asianum]
MSAPRKENENTNPAQGTPFFENTARDIATAEAARVSGYPEEWPFFAQTLRNAKADAAQAPAQAHCCWACQLSVPLCSRTTQGIPKASAGPIEQEDNDSDDLLADGEAVMETVFDGGAGDARERG